MKTFTQLVVVVGSMLAGGIVGGGIAQQQMTAEIEDAWDDITVVADGTLVANPAAYAWDPEQLADARDVKIVSNRRAAIETAWRD